MPAHAPDVLPLRIDIVSDVVCPWCIIGYKQLQKALAEVPGRFAPTLHWQPFELNPQMPPEGQDLAEHVAMKYGSTVEQSGRARSRLVELGASLGFHFDYFEGMRMVNTFAAHQLLYWAAGGESQTSLKLALFEAFFSRREDVSDPALLAEVAGRAGLPSGEAAVVLADGRYAEAVRKEQERWLEREVHAVPSFWFQDRYMVPGAQEPATFQRVLDKIYQREVEAAHAAGG